MWRSSRRLLHQTRRLHTPSPTWAIDAARAKLLPDDALSPIEQSRIAKENEPLAVAVERYDSVQAAIADTKLLAKDDEMKDLVQGELASLREQRQRVLQDIPAVLLPPPRNNTLPAMLSLNAGVGGDEATLCTAMIMRMYQRFAEIKGWTVEVMSMADGGNVYGHDGVKEVTMKISAGADEVYGQLQWESGVHRVQRVPPNDAKGRIQTSTLSVIVLPVIPETDTELVDPKDVQTEVMRSRGAGGQHVNKTESAVRLTHLPTGITVSMQDSRSQHQNKAWAWEILRSRLAEKQYQERVESKRAARRQELGTASRSDRIRTYNIGSSRVTDHRVGYTSGRLQAIMDGQLEELVEALQEDFTTRRIESILAGRGDLER